MHCLMPHPASSSIGPKAFVSSSLSASFPVYHLYFRNLWPWSTALYAYPKPVTIYNTLKLYVATLKVQFAIQWWTELFLGFIMFYLLLVWSEREYDGQVACIHDKGWKDILGGIIFSQMWVPCRCHHWFIPQCPLNFYRYRS